MPWAGRAGAPPPLPTITGVADEPTATAAVLTVAQAYGAGPAGVLRQATMSVIDIDFTTAGRLAMFACGLAGADEDTARAAMPGLASLAAAQGADGSALRQVQQRSSDVSHAFFQLLDLIPQQAITFTADRIRELTAALLPPDYRQKGMLLRQALDQHPITIAAPPPPPDQSPAAAPAVAAAIAAALGSSPDPVQVEAEKRLAAAKSSLQATTEDR